MTTPATKPSIFAGGPNRLFADADEQLLRKLGAEFSDELARLTRAYSVRDKRVIPPPSPSPSQILFGEDYDEVNRTLVGVLSLRWLWTNNYDAFVGSQSEATKLSRESFTWLFNFIHSTIAKTQDSAALLTSLLINDLGKDKQLAIDYEKTIRSRSGQKDGNIASLNHDMILLKAAEAGLVPSLERLPPDDRSDVLGGMRLGAVLNFGQLAQAETAPACLVPLSSMRGHERAFRLHFAEQLLDLAGAKGHEDWTCSKTLDEPTFDSYHAVYDACIGVIDERMTPRKAYDLVLVRRSIWLVKRGFRKLNIGQEDDRALNRVLCMGRVSDFDTAQLYEKTWSGLDPTVRESLVCSLNLDGVLGKPALQPTYMPSLLFHALKVSEKLKGRALQSALRYLRRVMDEPTKLDGHPIVIERSVLGVVTKVVQSQEFQSNPDILDTIGVPQAVTLLE